MQQYIDAITFVLKANVALLSHVISATVTMLLVANHFFAKERHKHLIIYIYIFVNNTY